MIQIGGQDFSFTAIFMSSSRATVVTDFTQADNPIVFVNPAFTALTGYTYKDAVGRNCRFLGGEATDRQVLAEIRAAISSGLPIHRQILNYRKNGEQFWSDVLIDPIRDASGRVVGYIGTQFDVTSYRLLELATVDAEQRLHDVTTHLPGYVYRRILKADGSLELPYFSPSVNEFLGLPPDSTPTAEEFYRHVHPDDYPVLQIGIAQSAADLTVFREEFRLVSNDETVRWVRSDANPRVLPNGDTVWDGIAIEITAEKQAQAELAFLTIHDPLTKLLNRTRFKHALRKILNSGLNDTQVVVFSVDLCSFQEINDALSHSAGDEVLVEIAQRLIDFTANTAGLVARVGGDEFAVLLPDVPSAQSALDIAYSMSENLARSMEVAGHELVVQVCMGVSHFPFSKSDVGPDVLEASDELLKRSAIALYSAKQEGPGSCRAYSSAFDARIVNRLLLKQSLRQALKTNEFEMYYQPMVDLPSGQIVGAEALVRWNHPELGLQPPDIFIPLAEASGLIVPLGEWIVHDVMRQRQLWTSEGLFPKRIAINVSGDQLSKSDFVAMVCQALAATGADPAGFEFELTESLMIETSAATRGVLAQLKSLGFWVTIDDFGTGHSTFKYLRDFPVDKIKIDQTFVRHLVADSNDVSIIRSVIALAHSLNIDVVAEGIETSMQRELLQDEGCKIGQGYLFSPPLSAAKFAALLRNGQSDLSQRGPPSSPRRPRARRVSGYSLSTGEARRAARID